MKSLIIVVLIALAAITWFFFRARVARAVRLATLAYLAFMAVRIATSDIDREQLQLAGLTLLFFASVWGVAWLVTRSMAK